MSSPSDEWISLYEARNRIEVDFGNSKLAGAVLRDVIVQARLSVSAREIKNSLSEQHAARNASASSILSVAQAGEIEKIVIADEFWRRMVAKRKSTPSIDYRLSTLRLKEKPITIGVSVSGKGIVLAGRIICLVDVLISKGSLEALIAHSQYREYYKAQYINLKPIMIERDRPSGIKKSDIEQLCADLYQLAQEGRLRSFQGLETVGDISPRGHKTGARAIAKIIEQRCVAKYKVAPTLETLDRRGEELIAADETARLKV